MRSVLWMFFLSAFIVAGCGKEAKEPTEIKVPSRVKVAHIMLEKDEVPDELTVESARALVFKRKLGAYSVSRQKEALARVRASKDFKCAVQVKLFKDKKRKGRQK